jgi:nitroreductase
MTMPVTPPNTISTEQLVSLVETACLAPSLHNSQPWRWSFDGGALDLDADHSRVGHHTDSTGREVILSCGAALDHLQVAAAAAGWQTAITRYPDLHDRDRLASVSFTHGFTADAHDRELSAAISHRRTDRLAFAPPEPWDELEGRLRAVVHGTAAEFDVVDDNGRPALADASRRTEQHRRDDASYRYELLWWTGRSHTSDGIPPSALPSSTEARHLDIARDFPVYDDGDRSPAIGRDQSKILVLSTFDDSHQNTLECGEALSRVLLECTAAGFATCPLTHMIEVHDSREMIRRLIGRRAQPQVLIRVGRALPTDTPAVRTPRRPVGEVLRLTS